MVNVVRDIASWLFLAAILATCQAGQSEFKFHITIPREIAAQAASRLAGNEQTPPPVLMLQGLENTSNEGMTIKVLGEPQPGSEGPRPILAVAGLVGEPNATPGSSTGKINVPVPLNEEAAKLLAGRSEITLILRVESDHTAGKSFKVDRVFFQLPKAH